LLSFSVKKPENTEVQYSKEIFMNIQHSCVRIKRFFHKYGISITSNKDREQKTVQTINEQRPKKMRGISFT